MIKRNDLDKFEKDLDALQKELTEAAIKKGLRKPLADEAKRLRTVISQDLSSEVPTVFGLDDAVRARVFSNLTGFKVYVDCTFRHGRVITGRGKLLPLPFWAEHGFKVPRYTKGRNGRPKHSTGPNSGAGYLSGKGAHVIVLYEPDLEIFKEKFYKIAQAHLDHVAEVYGK